MRRALALLILLAPLSTRAADTPTKVDVPHLLNALADLHWLANPPADGERTVQFSSYDRASKLQDGKLVNPFANGDCGHYLRVDTLPDGSKEHVLAETDGPGFVSRIWSANPKGIIRIYIDGAPKPALEADFIALTHGQLKPFVPPIGQMTSSGCNLYFPFPFAKSIKIVTTEGDQYFQVGVTYLPKNTDIESYSPEVLARSAPAIEAACKALLDPNHGRPEAQYLRNFTQRLEPGQTLSDQIDAPAAHGAAISWIRFKAEGQDLTATLAKTLVTIAFDDAAEPQVSAPLGDLFGSGPGINPYAALPSSVDKDGTMTLRWVMPFSKTARVRVVNGSDKPATFTGEFGVEPFKNADKALRFHARWKQEDDIQTKGGDGTKDWRALTAKGGPGRFVGLELNVYNPTSAWWGEGDEKVYVEGEAFPSTFGTGTEDYFGYAWCDPHTYTHPFHAESRCDGPGNYGNTSNVRYQILDQIPWHESLAFDIEVWHWEAVKVQYASIAFCYASAGAHVEPAPVADLSNRIIHSGKFIAFQEPDAIEAEKLHVVSLEGGQAADQLMSGFGNKWSNADQLWWTGQPGHGTLKLALPVPRPGRYELQAAFTKAVDYGTVQFSIGDKPLGPPIDLYHDGVVHSGPVSLGKIDAQQGDQVLTLTLTGKNPKSTNYMVGIDWFKLVPAPADK